MKKLLIVVDMINAFAAHGGTLSKSLVTGKEYGLEIIHSLKDRIDTYRNAKDPIVWLCDSHDKNDKEFERFPPHAIENTWEADIIDIFNPALVEKSPFEMRIPKKRYSGFYGTDLEYQLMRLAPEQIEVGGVCTSICIMDTVGGLANRDYNIVIRKDCVADFDPIAHDATLTRMAGLYGAIII